VTTQSLARPPMTDQKTNTLAPAPKLPHGLIMQPEELSNQLQAMSQHYNVLTPAIAISQLAPGFGANLAVVQIDSTITLDEKRTSGTGPDTYWSKFIHKDGNVRSLNKSGLQKIAQALGIQWDPRECRRVDNGRERNYWHWKYVGYVRTHDGNLQTVSGSRELDLRDGAAEATEMTSSSQLQKQRAMGNQMCETKAMQRAIRTFVRQSYTVDELKKPFLIVRFSFTPDMSDPEIKKLVTQQAMAGIGALYQAPVAGILPPAETRADDPDPGDDTTDLGSESSTSTPAAQAGRALEAVDFDIEAGAYSVRLDGGELVMTTKHDVGKALAAAMKAGQHVILTLDDAGQIAAFTAAAAAPAEMPLGQTTVASIHRENAKPPKTWVRYDVTFTDGKKASTFDTKLHALLDEAEKTRAAVKITTEENGNYDDKLTGVEVVDKRQSSLPMGEGDRY